MGGPRAPGRPLSTDAPSPSPLQASSWGERSLQGALTPGDPSGPRPGWLVSPPQPPVFLPPRGSSAHRLCRTLVFGSVLTSVCPHTLGDNRQAPSSPQGLWDAPLPFGRWQELPYSSPEGQRCGGTRGRLASLRVALAFPATCLPPGGPGRGPGSQLVDGAQVSGH